jgi:hypothetical protein
VYDVFAFRQFRLNVIRFLRLPLNVSEGALRDALRQCSSNLFASYLARLERAHEESGAPIEVPCAVAARPSRSIPLMSHPKRA